MMRLGVVICHGKLAFELLHTVERLMGRFESLLAFSNDGVAPQTLFEQVVEAIRSRKATELLILVDLRGGNCWRIGKMLEREFQKVHVVSGVNVPMVISFITKQEQLAFEELSRAVEQDGHRGILLE